MRQRAFRKRKSLQTNNERVKELQEKQNKLAPLVNSAWNFAYSSIWNNMTNKTKK